MRVLVAEDDPFSRQFLGTTLQRWGYEVVFASDGNQALSILKRDDAPRLAVLDWLMPGMDGIQLCREVRQQGHGHYIYLILLTAKEDTEDLVQAMDAGADDFITKSFDSRELKARLRAASRIADLEEALRRMATRDCLTQLWNRPAILDLLQRELARSERQGNPVSVVMGDIDHFKTVNDHHGHKGGDIVLRELAGRMRASLREYDHVGRYGGEEFLMILPEADEAGAMAVADKLLRDIASQPVSLDTDTVAVTMSLGVATTGQEQHMPADSLIRAADRALYAAKRAGRNRVQSAGAVYA